MAQRRAGKRRKVGYAVVGLGHIVQHAVLPAFRNARQSCELVALVSGDGEKRRALGTRYGVPTFDYAQLDDCLALPEVDAVYIALPNDLHADYVERCARRGAHVLCEKPMALSPADCLRMIRACDEADVKLMIAYRLHLERANLAGLEKILEGKIGEPRYFSSSFSYQVKEPNIRLDRERGGGPQWDIGLYCINAARYLFRAEPTEVFAQSATRRDDPRFRETPEQLSVTMRFPDERLAQFVCGFGAAATAYWEVVGTSGIVRLDDAYEYEGPRRLTWTVGDEVKRRRFAANDQFGPELAYFADCVLNDRPPEMDGYEGLADVRVIEAIDRSVVERRPIALEPFEKPVRPEPEMAYDEKPVTTERLVEAEAPHQE